MTLYIYKLIASEEEKSICEMESRSLLHAVPKWIGQLAYVATEQDVNIERSVFIKWKLVVINQAASEFECVEAVKQLQPSASYRMNWLDGIFAGKIETYTKELRRSKEKQIASNIVGKVNLSKPELQYAIVGIEHTYYIGQYYETMNSWQQHQTKPRQYSTALSTRLARTMVNIAIPVPSDRLTVVDPCCGIGTVLLEVAALGVHTEGFDLNPVVLKGTRENLSFFGYNVSAKFKDMLSLTSSYDVAFLDLPYNLCSVLPEADKRAMLSKLNQLAKRFLIVSIEPIEHILSELNINIVDRGVHYKGKFKRELFLCANENDILLKY